VTVYDSAPAKLPPYMTSHSFEGQSTSEFGDSVKLAAGTGREASEATVVMVTYQANDAFAYPITLNLYTVDGQGALHRFASRTQLFSIPARPPADDSCTGGYAGAWKADDGKCHFSYAFPVTFDLRGITLPDSFVYGIAYDTPSRSGKPAAPGTYPNNLNVGEVSVGPSVGAWTPNTVYVNTKDSPGDFIATEVGVFGPATPGPDNADQNGPVDYHPAVRFEVAP
jgi:hypothetical protein